MLRRVFIVTICMLLGSGLHVCAADLSETLRQKLPTLKGKARLQALYKLQELSTSSPDINYRVKCYNELIKNVNRQFKILIKPLSLSRIMPIITTDAVMLTVNHQNIDGR